MSEEKRQLMRLDQESAEDSATEIDLQEMFYYLLDKLRYIIGATLVGFVVMAIYAFILATPIYEATSSLYVISSSDSAINLSDLQIGSYLTSDYTQVFNTWEVQEMVLQNLNLNYTYEELDDMITVSNPSNTRILKITAASKNPEEATALSNEFATVAKQYISETMLTDEPSVLSKALRPTKPSSPKRGLCLVLGFVLGLVLSVGVFIVRFCLDDKIKTAEQIRKYANLPTLAVVPSNSKLDGNSRRMGKW